MANLIGQTNNPNEAGVLGESGQFEGVRGISHAGYHGGVVGINDNQSNTAGPGVYGISRGTGVWGESQSWMGVYGKSNSTTGGAGVMGEGDPSPGVIGKSTKWIGVYGETAGIENGPAGVWGEHKGGGIGIKAVSKDGVGLAAYSTSNEAIHAETQSTVTAAVAAYQLNAASDSAALYAKHAGGRAAAVFEGNVIVTGDISLSNADCAENFDVPADAFAEPGTVMVLDEAGNLRESHQPYDKRVVGVISGAGDYRPGLILDRRESEAKRQPIALLGKVFCKADAAYGPIEVGDLLTTSNTYGYAMKVSDPLKAFGAVIGKALRPLKEGRGLLPILIALQ